MSTLNGFPERLKSWTLVSIGWILAVLLIVSAGSMLLEGEWILGLAFLPLVLAVIPRVRIPAKLRPGSIIAAMLLLGVGATIQAYRDAEEAGATAAAESKAAEAARLAESKVEFAASRSKILKNMRAAIQQGDYLRALQSGVRYEELGDSVLSALMDEAREKKAVADRRAHEKKAAADRRAREGELVAEARRIPASDLRANINVYTQLMALNPGNGRYKERLEYYSTKLRSQEKAAARRIARFGARPEPSAWDGSYREVKRYLKAIANDPKSIDIVGCTEVSYWDKGWLVGCDYRGRNAFGGLIKTSNWFTIRHGRVVLMEEASAHRIR